MKITKTDIEDLYILEPKSFGDDRGYFMETYNKNIFKNELGLDIDFVQDNYSFNVKKNTLRGLHLQNNPYSQSKLVRCVKGCVLDIVVDLRKKSNTYKKWFSIELSEENKKQLFIPKGFAHGFITLTDDVGFEYKVDNFYNKDSEINILFNDVELGIEWGCKNPILSDKDKNAKSLKDCDINF